MDDLDDFIVYWAEKLSDETEEKTTPVLLYVQEVLTNFIQ